MIKHRRIGVIAALLMAVSVLFLSVGYFAPSVLAGVTGTSAPPYAAAMDKAKVLDIQIIAAEKDWASMLENATAEEYIPAAVIIDGVKIENVGVRPKGNSSLSMVARDDTTDRYSFKIEFDHYVAGQTWLGLDKLAVNNMQGDSTYMKEYLSYDIMNSVGVETPLYSFSNISVNGEAWGFYLAVEVLEDSYAQRVYGNDHGKLYKPESTGMGGAGIERDPEGTGMGEDMGGNPGGAGMGGGPGGGNGQSGGTTLQYTDDEVTSYSAIFDNAVFKSTERDYARVITALKKLSAGEELEEAVDVEATLKYFAAHTVLVNLDSYVSNMSHNYYLYEKDGRLTMLPWDFNLAFGGFRSGDASAVVNFPIDTPVSGISLEERPMLAKLLEVDEYRAQYHEYLQQIVDNYFDSGLFSQTIDTLDTLISSFVESDPTAFYDFASYQSGVAELKKLGELRARSIEGQLSGSIPSTTEAQSANPDALVDASGLNLSALGSMGGGSGGFGGMPGGEGAENGGNGMGPAVDKPSFDRANMEQVMEILRAAGDGELTEEQLALLEAQGMTEDQIAMFRDRGQGGFADGGGRAPGMREDGRQQVFPEGTAPSASGMDAAAWALLSGSALLLLGGLLFVARYKRRRWA